MCVIVLTVTEMNMCGIAFSVLCMCVSRSPALIHCCCNNETVVYCFLSHNVFACPESKTHLFCSRIDYTRMLDTIIPWTWQILNVPATHINV